MFATDPKHNNVKYSYSICAQVNQIKVVLGIEKLLLWREIHIEYLRFRITKNLFGLKSDVFYSLVTIFEFIERVIE